MRKLNRILAQYLPITLDQTYLLRQNPPWDLQLQGDIIYEDALKDSRFDGVISIDDVPQICVERGIIQDVNYQKDIVATYNRITSEQMKMYESRQNPKAVARSRSLIKGMRNSISEVQNKIFQFEQKTREFWAAQIREDWILSQSLYFLDRTPVEVIPDISLVRDKYYSNMISEEEIREISRSEPWRTLWSTRKGAIFEFPPMNSQQISLARWSKFYDNVFKSHECPDASIVADDDMLDGWLAFQAQPEDKKTVSSKVARHSEQFIVVDNAEEAQAVWNSNSPEARARMKSRQNQVKRQGSLKHTQLSDFKLDMINKTTGQS